EARAASAKLLNKLREEVSYLNWVNSEREITSNLVKKAEAIVSNTAEFHARYNLCDSTLAMYDSMKFLETIKAIQREIIDKLVEAKGAKPFVPLFEMDFGTTQTPVEFANVDSMDLMIIGGWDSAIKFIDTRGVVVAKHDAQARVYALTHDTSRSTRYLYYTTQEKSIVCLGLRAKKSPDQKIAVELSPVFSYTADGVVKYIKCIQMSGSFTGKGSSTAKAPTERVAGYSGEELPIPEGSRQPSQHGGSQEAFFDDESDAEDEINNYIICVSSTGTVFVIDNKGSLVISGKAPGTVISIDAFVREGVPEIIIGTKENSVFRLDRHLQITGRLVLSEQVVQVQYITSKGQRIPSVLMLKKHFLLDESFNVIKKMELEKPVSGSFQVRKGKGHDIGYIGGSGGSNDLWIKDSMGTQYFTYSLEGRAVSVSGGMSGNLETLAVNVLPGKVKVLQKPPERLLQELSEVIEQALKSGLSLPDREEVLETARDYYRREQWKQLYSYLDEFFLRIAGLEKASAPSLYAAVRHGILVSQKECPVTLEIFNRGNANSSSGTIYFSGIIEWNGERNVPPLERAKSVQIPFTIKSPVAGVVHGSIKILCKDMEGKEQTFLQDIALEFTREDQYSDQMFRFDSAGPTSVHGPQDATRPAYSPPSVTSPASNTQIASSYLPPQRPSQAPVSPASSPYGRTAPPLDTASNIPIQKELSTGPFKQAEIPTYGEKIVIIDGYVYKFPKEDSQKMPSTPSPVPQQIQQPPAASRNLSSPQPTSPSTSPSSPQSSSILPPAHTQYPPPTTLQPSSHPIMSSSQPVRFEGQTQNIQSDKAVPPVVSQVEEEDNKAIAELEQRISAVINSGAMDNDSAALVLESLTKIKMLLYAKEPSWRDFYNELSNYIERVETAIAQSQSQSLEDAIKNAMSVQEESTPPPLKTPLEATHEITFTSTSIQIALAVFNKADYPVSDIVVSIQPGQSYILLSSTQQRIEKLLPSANRKVAFSIALLSPTPSLEVAVILEAKAGEDLLKMELPSVRIEFPDYRCTPAIVEVDKAQSKKRLNLLSGLDFTDEQAVKKLMTIATGIGLTEQGVSLTAGATATRIIKTGGLHPLHGPVLVEIKPIDTDRGFKMEFTVFTGSDTLAHNLSAYLMKAFRSM
ncbi:MAG: hypothetical protein QW728_01340, partial [Thermoplasmata archaeon]